MEQRGRGRYEENNLISPGLMVVPFDQFGVFCQGHSGDGSLEKACHVKSEMHIRHPSGTVMQVARKMNLEFRVDVSFRNRPMGDIMMPI